MASRQPNFAIWEGRREFVLGLTFRCALAGIFGAAFLVSWATGLLPGSVATYALSVCGALAVVNLAYWTAGARAGFPRRHFVVHWIVDIVALTVLIFVLGGIDAPYAGLAYLSLVTTAAVFASRRMALWLAGGSALCLLLVLLAEEVLRASTSGIVWGHHYTRGTRWFAFATAAIFLFWLASMFGRLADQLKTANESLVQVGARIEEQNRTLERKVAERTEALARATQEIEDLVHIVSHDLKNVAVAVTETARKLVSRESVNLSERGKSYAENLLEDGRTMSRMLEDLLLLFRHTEGAGGRAEWVDVDAVVRQSLRQLQYQVEAKKIEVSVGPLPSVFAETQKMRHIFDNLLNNACKYVGDKKPAKVDVSGSANGAVVRYVVRDNGVGLDERQRARIFQLYHRSPVQAVEGIVQDGHGVGLAIVKRIVERYGGTISVESMPREGTTFEVTLPRGDGPRA